MWDSALWSVMIASRGDDIQTEEKIYYEEVQEKGKKKNKGKTWGKEREIVLFSCFLNNA